MKKQIMRSIGDDRFQSMVADTAFLVDRIRRERGELDLRLRDNYFNLYYKGNSMAKVAVLPPGRGYEISVHRKFTGAADEGLDPNSLPDYVKTVATPTELRSALSKTVLDQIARRIKRINWGEEVTFEQMLITDNPPTPEFMIIDRQITGGALGRSRLDLLALRRVGKGDAEYQLVILEVKLGNNRELEGDVLTQQLRGYIGKLTDDFAGFSRCYEKTYRQMRVMGLMRKEMPSEIRIVGPVEGVIVVGGYSGMTNDALRKLREIKRSAPHPADAHISLWRRPSVLTSGVEPL
jgi:hypothetical protein